MAIATGTTTIRRAAKDGTSVQARYAPTKKSAADTGNIHTTFQTGDEWMQTSTDGTTWGDWIKIVGEDGTNGSYVNSEFNISKSLTAYNTPSADGGTGNCYYKDWKDAPQATNQTYPYLWCRQRLMVWSDYKNAYDFGWTDYKYIRLTGEPGSDGINGADGVQPNLYGYDCALNNAAYVHTSNGFAGVVTANTSGNMQIYHNKDNGTTRYPHGTYALSGKVKVVAVSGMTTSFTIGVGADGADKTFSKTGAVAGTEYSFSIKLTTNSTRAKQSTTVPYIVISGLTATSSKAMIVVSEWKFEEASSLVGTHTPFAGLAEDGILQGQNLLPYSKNFLGWTNIADGAVGASTGYQGCSGVKGTTNANKDITFASKTIALAANTWYTLSWYAKSSVNGVTLYTDVEVTNANYNSVCVCDKDGVIHKDTSSYPQYEHGLTTEWQLHTLTFRTLASENCQINFKLKAQTASRTAYVSMPKLEVGQKATPWQQNEDDRKGVQGSIGAVVRMLGEWKSNTAIRNDDQFIDVVSVTNEDTQEVIYWQLGKNWGTNASFPTEKPTAGDHWQQYSNLPFVASQVILGQNGHINLLGSSQIFVSNPDDKTKTKGWLIKEGAITHTETKLELTKDGKLYDPDGLHLHVGNPKTYCQNLLQQCNYKFDDGAWMVLGRTYGVPSTSSKTFSNKTRNTTYTLTGLVPFVSYYVTGIVTSKILTANAKGEITCTKNSTDGDITVYPKYNIAGHTDAIVQTAETTSHAFMWAATPTSCKLSAILNNNYIIQHLIEKASTTSEFDTYSGQIFAKPYDGNNNGYTLPAGTYTFTVYVALTELEINGKTQDDIFDSNGNIKITLSDYIGNSTMIFYGSSVLNVPIKDSINKKKTWYAVSRTVTLSSSTSVSYRLGMVLNAATTKAVFCYGGVKIEEGSTFTGFSDESIVSGLKQSGIDISANQIKLTTDNLVCENNSGERTMWLDALGNFTTTGVQASLVQTITDASPILISSTEQVTADEDNSIKDNCNDSNGNYYYLDVLRCGNVIKMNGVSRNIYVPYYIADDNYRRTATRFGQDGTLHWITQQELTQLIGKRIIVIMDSNAQSANGSTARLYTNAPVTEVDGSYERVTNNNIIITTFASNNPGIQINTPGIYMLEFSYGILGKKETAGSNAYTYSLIYYWKIANLQWTNIGWD